MSQEKDKKIIEYINKYFINCHKPKDLNTIREFQHMFQCHEICMHISDKVDDFFVQYANDKKKKRENTIDTSVNLKSDLSILASIENQRMYVSLWEKRGSQNMRWTQYVGVQGPSWLQFPIMPSYIIKMNQKQAFYLWEFDKSLPETMMKSLRLLSMALSYLAPGAKPLDYRSRKYIEYRAWIPVPGIPEGYDGKPGTLEKTGKVYSYTELWETIAPEFPVGGKSLWKYLKSESLYIPGLYTTREILGIVRFNKLLAYAQGLTKQAFAAIKTTFLFLAYCFGHDCGMTDEQIETKLTHFGLRRNVDVFGAEVNDARPLHPYKFTDVAIVKALGEGAQKFFSYVAPKRTPRAEIHKRTMKAREAVIRLANAGHTIRQIAEKLGLTISTVKRHRTIGVKSGLIASNPI